VLPHLKKKHHTDFLGAVAYTPDESVVFSWFEWPDEAMRDAPMAQPPAPMGTDPRFNTETNPPPFDVKRMILGGYVQGFLVPVAAG